MGYVRGVPHNPKARLARQAAQMRSHYLTTGRGCKTRAKVIAKRVGGER